MTSIIVGSQEYSLKYDVKQNKLRDLTWDELKILYGKGCKVICPCFNREYIISSSFISSHIQSRRHKKWLEQEENTYIKEKGHCSDIENQMDTLYKRQREHKVLYHNLCETKKECDIKLEDITNKNLTLMRDIEKLKKQKMEKHIIYNNKLLRYEIENKVLLEEIKELEIKKSFNNKMNEKNIIEEKTTRIKKKNILSNFRLR